MSDNMYVPSIADAVSARGKSLRRSSSFSPHRDLELSGSSSSLISRSSLSGGAPHPALGGP